MLKWVGYGKRSQDDNLSIRFKIELATLSAGHNGFGAILAHPAVNSPPPQRLPTAEENRWFIEGLSTCTVSLRAGY
jgi:hypothetical protein